MVLLNLDLMRSAGCSIRSVTLFLFVSIFGFDTQHGIVFCYFSHMFFKLSMNNKMNSLVFLIQVLYHAY